MNIFFMDCTSKASIDYTIVKYLVQSVREEVLVSKIPMFDCL